MSVSSRTGLLALFVAAVAACAPAARGPARAGAGGPSPGAEAHTGAEGVPSDRDQDSVPDDQDHCPGDPEDEGGLLWSDPALGIDWRVTDPVLSKKDAAFPPLAQLTPAQLPQVKFAAAGRGS